jgi:glycosyltransferase involved in cell wall biosynthesis
VSAAVAAREPRVLQVVDNLELGGAQRVAVSLVAGLRARGVDARVAHLGLGGEHPLTTPLRATGAPILNLRIGSLLDPCPPIRLANYMRRERIDVVHTHLRYASLVGRVAAALARRPVVSTIHNIVETGSGWRDAVRLRLDYLTARACCTALIAVSETQRQAYLRATSVDPARIETHRNGVATDIFRPDPEARARLRAELRVGAETPLFMTVARLEPEKGIEHLLEAAARLRHRAPAARFAVVGAGELRAELEARAAALGTSDTVRFLGARTDVPALLAAADVYVHPSLFEALPMSILEAMAVGLPAVATDVGGVREIVAHEQTGLLVSPACADALAAAMARLLDPASRAALGAAGRAWVKVHASTGVWVDDHLRLFRRVAGAHP